MLDLVGNPEDQFSHNKALFIVYQEGFYKLLEIICFGRNVYIINKNKSLYPLRAKKIFIRKAEKIGYT